MHKLFLAGLLGVACAFAVYLLATGLPEKEEAAERGPAFTVPDRPVDADASNRVYRSLCISCHGDRLQGGVGPELASIGSTMTKEQLFKTISDGRRGMPSFEDRLTEDEIITVSTWLASLK